MLAARMPFGIGTYAGGTLTCVGQSRRGIMYQLINRGTRGNLSPVWDLPVYLPAASEAGPHTVEFPNYKFYDIETAITEHQNVAGDVDFQPRWSSAGTLEFEVRIAPDWAPKLWGNAIELTKAALAPSAIGLRKKWSGGRIQTGSFTPGDGAEVNRPHGEAATVAVAGGIPSRDIAKAFSKIESVDELNVLASAEVAAFKAPTTQYTISVLAKKVMPQLQNGSPVRVYSMGDEMIDPGWISLRVIGSTHTTKNKMDLRVQVI